MEDQVSYPLSIHLQGIRGVRVVRSSSDFHFSMIHVIFTDDVGFPTARQRVLERLAQAGKILPDGVVPHPPPDALATGQIYWYTIEGGGLDLGRLRALQDWYVGPQLSAVPGVAEVASVGGYPIEYQVNVDPRKLRTRGVTLAEVVRAVGESNATVGGPIIQKGNAEYIVRSVGWLGARAGHDDDAFDPSRAVRDLERAVLAATADGSILHVGDVASVTIGPGPRRGILEKDGSEVTGGVVLMAYGENPLAVTRRLKAKIRDLQPGLPPGVRIVAFYDRTPLIRGAIGTVTGTITEAIVTATICVVLILLHVRASFVIALTLPLAALGSFALMASLRALGIADIETNIMSLAGIAISVGVLVDSSIVMVENAMHRLRDEFGDEPVRGDIRAVILPACQTVGRPIFFSVVIMLLSFLPVFALGGMEGKMFRPLAFTKSFALVTVALLAVTLVPALCTYLLEGTDAERARELDRAERDRRLPPDSLVAARPPRAAGLAAGGDVRGRPGPSRQPHAVPGNARAGARRHGRRAADAARVARWRGSSLIVVALVADQMITPLGREFITPVDEGMVMNMPMTVSRASVTESADDLKACDMILCRFPEVDMVVGKAGRAESPTDPAPMEMIETMVNFRPREFWPKRKLLAADATIQTRAVLDALVARGLVKPPTDSRGPGRAGRRRRAPALRRRPARVRLPAQPGVRALAGQPRHRSRRPRLRASASPVGRFRAAAQPRPRPTRGGNVHADRPRGTGRASRRDRPRDRCRRARDQTTAQPPGSARNRRRGPTTRGPACPFPSSRSRRSPRSRRNWRSPSPRACSSGARIVPSSSGSAPTSTRPYKCPVGPTSGPCRSRTASTCSRQA